MKEIEFKNWLIDNGTNPKVARDVISRLKKVRKKLMAVTLMISITLIDVKNY